MMCEVFDYPVGESMECNDHLFWGEDRIPNAELTYLFQAFGATVADKPQIIHSALYCS
jgi:hypothetical protein